MNGPNELEHFIAQGTKGFPETNTLAYWAHHKLQRRWSLVNKTLWANLTTLYFLVLWIRPQMPHLQYLIFFITYKWFHWPCVLHYIRLKRLARDKYSSLLGAIVSYNENKVLWIKPYGPIWQHFIFFLTDEQPQWPRVLHYSRQEKITRDKSSSLLCTILSYEENEVLWIRPHGSISQNFIFFITYVWAKWARVLHYSRLEKLIRDKHSMLLNPIISYEENEVL